MSTTKTLPVIYICTSITFFSACNEQLYQIHRSNYGLSNIVSLAGIVSLPRNLKTKNSTGPDNITNTFFYDGGNAEMLSEFPKTIFRTSFRSGRFPHDWKEGRSAPVHKKGDKDLVPTYRSNYIVS